MTPDILPKIISGEIKHILIADLVTPLSKSTKTRQSLVAFLNNLIEEGVAKMTSHATIWEKEVRCGLITTVTDEALADGRHEWAKMGFLSRMFLFSYSYPISTVYRIFDSLIEDKSGVDERIKLRFPNHPKDVVLPNSIAKEWVPISMKIGESMNLYGFRFFLNTKTLLKSLALLNGNAVVTNKEFEEFLELSRYLNCQFNPI